MKRNTSILRLLFPHVKSCLGHKLYRCHSHGLPASSWIQYVLPCQYLPIPLLTLGNCPWSLGSRPSSLCGAYAWVPFTFWCSEYLIFTFHIDFITWSEKQTSWETRLYWTVETNVFVSAGFADLLFVTRSSDRAFLQLANVPAIWKYVQFSKCKRLFFPSRPFQLFRHLPERHFTLHLSLQPNFL